MKVKTSLLALMVAGFVTVGMPVLDQSVGTDFSAAQAAQKETKVEKVKEQVKVKEKEKKIQKIKDCSKDGINCNDNNQQKKKKKN